MARPNHLVVVLNLLLYFVITAGLEVYARFRMTIMPLVAVLTGCGAISLVNSEQ